MNTLSHADYVLLWVGELIAWGSVGVLLKLILQPKLVARRKRGKSLK